MKKTTSPVLKRLVESQFVAGKMLVSPMTNPYLPPREAKSVKARISVRLEKAETEDLKVIAKLWNAIDKQLGRKRGRKWKPSGLMEFFIRVGMAEFWKAVGGHPAPKESQEALIRRAVEATEAQERSG